MSNSTLSSLVVIFVVAVAGPFVADVLPKGAVPVVVLEIAMGVVVGPRLLDLVSVDQFIESLANFGLATLMFIAGYETDLAVIRGRPLNLALRAWVVSLGLGLAAGALLSAEGVVLSSLLVGVALTTTALGTLIPILRDAGVLTRPFGAFVLAAGAVGEFVPIIAIAVLLSSDNEAGTALLLLAFVAGALLVAAVALLPQPPRVVRLLRTTINSSAQLPVRICVLLLVLLVWLAAELRLDVLLGAFAAGLIVRLATGGRRGDVLHSKLDALGFGFFIPIFFVITGVRYDVDALSDAATAARIPLFLALFLVVRGLPALLYRADLRRDEIVPLALLSSTALPLVVAVTTIGVQTGRMHSSTAAALVGAAMISVLVFPLLALAWLSRTEQAGS